LAPQNKQHSEDDSEREAFEKVASTVDLSNETN